MALTAKQDMFVREYLVDLNATQAAIRAGYSEDTARQVGSENLSKPYIQDAIQKEMQKRAEKVSITAENVLQSIIEVRDRCMQAVPVYSQYDSEKEEAEEWKFDATNALKANDMLMRHLGEYNDKSKLELEITKMPEIKLTK